MTIEHTDAARLANLLTDASAKRDAAIIEPVLADQRIYQQEDRALDWPSLITHDAITLYERMTYLQSHPRLPRMLGGSAVKLISTKTGLTTPVLLSTETELIGNNVVGLGYEFVTGRHPYSQSRHNRHVLINEVYYEKDSGSRNTTTKYKINFRLDSDIPATIESSLTRSEEDDITILGLIRAATRELRG